MEFGDKIGSGEFGGASIVDLQLAQSCTNTCTHTYVCTYICTNSYAWLYLCTVRTYSCTYVQILIHMYVHTYSCTYVHTNSDMHVHTYIFMYIRTNSDTHVRTYIFMYIRTNSDMHVRTYMYTCPRIYKCMFMICTECLLYSLQTYSVGSTGSSRWPSRRSNRKVLTVQLLLSLAERQPY